MGETCPTCNGPVSRNEGKLFSKRSSEEFDRWVKRLYRFTPNTVPELADPPCSECGHIKGSEHDKWSGGDHYFKAGPPENVPFFTEAFLYDLMGKDDARSVLAYIHRLIEAAGGDPYELERMAWSEKSDEDEEW